MTMNQVWIEDFLVLAESGNFSRAADLRHVTQPAFSRRIRALEEWLGADLFDRSSQPARLTATGLWFRQTALDLQARVDALPGEARAIAEAAAASLSFAATHSLSFTFLPRWLRMIEARTAVGPIRLVSDVQQKCEDMLLHNQIQFVVAHGHPDVPGPLGEAGCAHVVIGSDQLIPVSAPTDDGGPLHAWPARGRARAQTLDYSAESGLGRILVRLLGPTASRSSGSPALTAHLASVLRSWVLDGRGLAWLPGMLVDEDLLAGRLVLAGGVASEAATVSARGPASAPTTDGEGAVTGSIALQIRLYRATGELPPAAAALWQAAGDALKQASSAAVDLSSVGAAATRSRASTAPARSRRRHG